MYEVFLSFRGPDTRKGFTGFLYDSLRDAGVHVFRDDEELQAGDEIVLNLTEAINQSKISIPIFSKSYAASKWCLNELAEIVECRKRRNQLVMPVFYDVTPSEVRNQTGRFAESFRLHMREFDGMTVGKWKGALREVGGLKGWDLTDGTSRLNEAGTVKEVVDKVLRQLKKAYLVETDRDFLVGVNDRVEEIMSMINVNSDEVKILGIHGMGGIGKTTLAKIVYNQLLSYGYEGSSFLANVRESSEQPSGIICLQNQLISDILKKKWPLMSNVDEGIKTIRETLSEKKVLIFLDDVSERNQLKALVGDRTWFDSETRIIITTRNKEILNVVKADWKYEVTPMDFNHSLQLFSKHAFRIDSPPADYVTCSEEVVKLTGGLPLALEVIGSLLHGKSQDSWEARLQKLKKVPHAEVEKSLRITYEELDGCQKQIFLDVACLFTGYDKRIALYFWDDSNLFPEEAIEVLEHMSILKIKEDSRIWMHDQFRDLGKMIISREGNCPENQSRLWDHEQALSVAMKAKKAENVQAMCLKFNQPVKCSSTRQLLARAPNLTFLQVDGLHFHASFARTLGSIWQKGTNRAILPNLRWLSWHSFEALPLILQMKFSIRNLVILDLSRNPLTHEWRGWSQIKLAQKLKVLNLSECDRLARTPDLLTHDGLERLILRNCRNLVQMDKSVGQLKRLVSLDLTKCHSLRRLPEEISNLEALVELLIGYTGIAVLPDSIGKLKNLKVLRADYTQITELPVSIVGAVNLQEIYFENWNYMGKIPCEIGRLSYLGTLKITGLHSAIYKAPTLPQSLVYLHLHFEQYGSSNEVPDLSNLVNLRELDLRLYEHLASPDLWWIGRLSKLESLTLTSYGITWLSTDDLSSFTELKKLHLLECKRLMSLPKLPSGLLNLHLAGCHLMERRVDVSSLNMLLELEVCRSAVTAIHGLPSSLLELHVRECELLSTFGDVSNLNRLLKLQVYYCSVTEICEIPSSLVKLCIVGCDSLKAFGDISNLDMLSELRVVTSPITDIQGLQYLKNLKTLELAGLDSLERLPVDLASLSQLKQFTLYHCLWMQSLPRLPSSLEILNIKYCKFIAASSIDISNLKRLRVLAIVDEFTIREIQGLGDLDKLQILMLVGVYALERLPDLGSLSKLKQLDLQDCPSLLRLPRLPSNLGRLYMRNCPAKMLDVSNLNNLSNLQVKSCGVEEIQGLHGLVNLNMVKFDDYYLDPTPRSLLKRLECQPFHLKVT